MSNIQKKNRKPTADLTFRFVDSFRWKILAGSVSFSLSDDSSPVRGLPGAAATPSAIPSHLVGSTNYGCAAAAAAG